MEQTGLCVPEKTVNFSGTTMSFSWTQLPLQLIEIVMLTVLQTLCFSPTECARLIARLFWPVDAKLTSKHSCLLFKLVIGLVN